MWLIYDHDCVVVRHLRVACFSSSVIFVLFRLQGCGYTSDPRHKNLNLTLILTLTLTLTLRPYCLNFPERTLPCIQSKEYENHLRNVDTCFYNLSVMLKDANDANNTNHGH